jgi:hypothetical protein
MITGFVELLRSKVHGVTKFEYFFRNIPACLSKNSLSELLNKFGLWSLNNEIWKACKNNIEQFRTKQSISVTLLLTVIFSLCVIIPLKCFYKPIHKFFVGINDGQSKRIIVMLSLFSISTLQFYADATLSINNSSQVTQLFISPHIDPSVECISTDIAYHRREINNTLNDLSGQIFLKKNKAKVCTPKETRRGIPEEVIPPNRNIWSLKSNSKVICGNKSAGDPTKSGP